MCCFENFGVVQTHNIVKKHNMPLQNQDYKTTPQCKPEYTNDSVKQCCTKLENKWNVFPPKIKPFRLLKKKTRNLTLKQCCGTASARLVVVAVNSLPLDSIPSTIVAVAGVSSHGDRLPPCFCNTTTSLYRLPPTILVSLGRSVDFLTLASPFHTLDHPVSAFPSSCSCCRRLSADFLTLFSSLLRLAETISTSSDFLPPCLTNTLQILHFGTLSLSTSALLLAKRICCT